MCSELLLFQEWARAAVDLLQPAQLGVGAASALWRHHRQRRQLTLHGDWPWESALELEGQRRTTFLSRWVTLELRDCFCVKIVRIARDTPSHLFGYFLKWPASIYVRHGDVEIVIRLLACFLCNFYCSLKTMQGFKGLHVAQLILYVLFLCIW